MRERNIDPAFDPEEIEEQDPTGEEGFEAHGFEDAADGGPDFAAPGLEDDAIDRRPGGRGQKVAGIPEAEQKHTSTPAEGHPDSSEYVVRERGGESKGDPAVGGTRDE
jgi:hypothetical protein